MPRHRQEHELEFRKEPSQFCDYPDLRGLVVWAYGSTIEGAVKAARKKFRLDESWALIRAEQGQP